MTQLLFTIKLFSALSLDALAVLYIQLANHTNLILALLLLAIPLSQVPLTTSGMNSSFETQVATFTTPLSPTLSTHEFLYPQDIATELQFWEQLNLLQPTHRDVLLNQQLLNELLQKENSGLFTEQIQRLDPNFVIVNP